MEGWGRIDDASRSKKPSSLFASWQRLWNQQAPSTPTKNGKEDSSHDSVLSETSALNSATEELEDTSSASQVHSPEGSVQRQPPSTTAQLSPLVKRKPDDDNMLSPVSTPVSTPDSTPQKQSSQYLSYRESLLDRINRMTPPAKPTVTSLLSASHTMDFMDSSTDGSVDLSAPRTPQSGTSEATATIPRSTSPSLSMLKDSALPSYPTPPLQAMTVNPLYPSHVDSSCEEEEDLEEGENKKQAQDEAESMALSSVSKLEPFASPPPNFSKSLLDPPSPHLARKPPTPSLFYRPNSSETSKILGIAPVDDEGHSLEVSDSDVYSTDGTYQDETEGEQENTDSVTAANPLTSRTRLPLTQQMSIVAVAGRNDSTDNGTVDTGNRSLTAKLRRFFRGVQRYEAFDNHEDNDDMIENNYSVSFSSTEVDDNVTLSTNASSALLGTSALARHMHEQAAKTGTPSHDDTMTNASYPLADSEHISPSLVFFDQSTVTGGSDSEVEDDEEEEETTVSADERGLQLNISTLDVPMIKPDTSTQQPSCSMSSSGFLQISSFRETNTSKDALRADGAAGIIKAERRIPRSPTKDSVSTLKKRTRKRGMTRCIIRVSAIFLLAACIAVLIVMLTNLFDDDSDDQSDIVADQLGPKSIDSPSSPPSPRPFSSPATPTVFLPASGPSASPESTPTAKFSLPTTEKPSTIPSESPSFFPSELPSEAPSHVPSEAPSTNPSATPSTILSSRAGRIDTITSLLETQGIEWEGQIVASNDGSPQYEALDWLVSDPNFETYSEEIVVQMYALAVLSFAMEGGDTRRLRSLRFDPASPCNEPSTVQGEVVCEPTGTGVLTVLDWSGKSLARSIPKEIGLLGKLKTIRLSNNSLTGGIPASMGSLEDLEELNLAGNSLEDLPESVVNCTNLREMDLSYNSFNMELPTFLSEIQTLRVLRLNDNQFRGPITDDFYNLRDLNVLDLTHNGITGAIGSGIANCTNLVELHMKSNMLTSFADEVFSLSSLQVLDLSDNMIGHFIPFVGEQFSARVIRLNNNNIDGRIPGFGRLSSSLEELDLSHNQIQGRIPLSLSYCENLRILKLNSNNLWGKIPKELRYLRNLDLLRIDSNGFYGKVPKDVCRRLSGIQFLADCVGERPVECDCCSCCSEGEECCSEGECSTPLTRKLSRGRLRRG